MVAYTETAAYLGFVSRLEKEIVSLSEQKIGLGAMHIRQEENRKRTTDEEKQLLSVNQRLKILVHQRENAASLNFHTWPELFDLWEASYGRTWTDEELVLMAQTTAMYEGKGEKPLRHRLGLPIEATNASSDLPGDEEIKYLSPINTRFRVGKFGKRAYISMLRELSDEHITPDMWDGEVPTSKIYNSLPDNVRSKLQTNLAPERVLSCYEAIYLTTDTGHSRVPKADYHAAFGLSNVSQYSPIFRLKREYVESQVRSTVPTRQ